MNETKPLPTRKNLLRARRRRESIEPELRFSPSAWAKLVYLRDLGQTEVGGFAVSAADDLLAVEDIQMVRQECSSCSVVFDDQSVADLFDRQVDAGLKPERFSRIWVHTHPGNSPTPSSTDEETFERVFGPMEWAVMFILAHGGQTYARLRFNVGPRGEMTIPVSVDYTRLFAASDWESWSREYGTNLVDIDSLPLVNRAPTNETTMSVPDGLNERQHAFDPFFDPERRAMFDEYEMLLEGYFYDS
jgi:proteasome lid subunit RPN8/RPN11